MSVKSDLQGAANVDVFMGLLDSNGVNLTVEQDLALTRQMTGRNFQSRRRQVVKSMERSGIIANDGSINAAVAGNVDQINRWFTGMMAILDPSSVPTPPPEEEDVVDEVEVPSTESSSRRNTRGGRAVDNWIHSVLGAGIVTEIIAEMSASRIDNILDRDKDRRPSRRPPEETADLIEAEARVAGRATKSVMSRVGSGVGSVLIAALIAIVVVAVFGLAYLMFWPLTVTLTIIGWLLLRLFNRRSHRNMLQWVGDDLPTVLRTTRVKWADFCDPDQPEKWIRVYNQAAKHLDSRFPWHDSREDRIDNLLFELTARINKYYSQDGLTDAQNIARAARVMDSPSARIPKAVYRLRLEDEEDAEPSLLQRIRDRQNSL